MAKKIRLKVVAQTEGNETRYALKSHTGEIVYRSLDMRIYGYLPSGEDNLKFWHDTTSETPEQALKEHAPPEYDILPPETRVTYITIETFSSDKHTYTFYVERDTMPTFLIAPKDVKFYSFETLEGVEEKFAYSDIRHISFKEV